MMKIAIIDYGMGNLHSAAKALEKVGAQVKVTRDPELVRHGDTAIAGCLANYAALNLATEIAFESTGERDIFRVLSGFGDSSSAGEFTDTGFGTVRGINDFGGFL